MSIQATHASSLSFSFVLTGIHDITKAPNQNNTVTNLCDVVDARYTSQGDFKNPNDFGNDNTLSVIKSSLQNQQVSKEVELHMQSLYRSIPNQATDEPLYADQSVIPYVSTKKHAELFRVDSDFSAERIPDAITNIVSQGSAYVRQVYTLSEFFTSKATQEQRLVSYRANTADRLAIHRVTVFADMSDKRFDGFWEVLKKSYETRIQKPYQEVSIGMSGLRRVVKIVYHVCAQLNAQSTNYVKMYILFVPRLGMEKGDTVSQYCSAGVGEPWNFNIVSKVREIFDDFGRHREAFTLSLDNHVGQYEIKLDTNHLIKLWNREDIKRYPAFVWSVQLQNLAKSFYDLYRQHHLPGHVTDEEILRNISGDVVNLCYGNSMYGREHYVDVVKTKLPIPSWIRDLFSTDSHIEAATSSKVASETIKFLLACHLRNTVSDTRRFNQQTKGLFNTVEQDLFPANIYVATVVFQLVVAQCISVFKDVWFTSWPDDFQGNEDKSQVPVPWIGIVQLCDSLNIPRSDFPNRVGLSHTVESMDLAAFSRISAWLTPYSTEAATNWNLLRAALCRMALSDNSYDQDRFMRSAGGIHIGKSAFDAFRATMLDHLPANVQNILHTGYDDSEMDPDSSIGYRVIDKTTGLTKLEPNARRDQKLPTKAAYRIMRSVKQNGEALQQVGTNDAASGWANSITGKHQTWQEERQKLLKQNRPGNDDFDDEPIYEISWRYVIDALKNKKKELESKYYKTNFRTDTQYQSRIAVLDGIIDRYDNPDATDELNRIVKNLTVGAITDYKTKSKEYYIRKRAQEQEKLQHHADYALLKNVLRPDPDDVAEDKRRKLAAYNQLFPNNTLSQEISDELMDLEIPDPL